MTSRYVVVRSLDGVEAIVPNETLVTTTVLNHSYTIARTSASRIPVQVSYDSDVELALALMEEAARARAARAEGAESRRRRSSSRFADSGIDLELGVWISDPENGQRQPTKRAQPGDPGERSRRNGIRIPFPQREMRIVDRPPRRSSRRAGRRERRRSRPG